MCSIYICCAPWHCQLTRNFWWPQVSAGSTAKLLAPTWIIILLQRWNSVLRISDDKQAQWVTKIFVQPLFNQRSVTFVEMAFTKKRWANIPNSILLVTRLSYHYRQIKHFQALKVFFVGFVSAILYSVLKRIEGKFVPEWSVPQNLRGARLFVSCFFCLCNLVKLHFLELNLRQC